MRGSQEAYEFLTAIKQTLDYRYFPEPDLPPLCVTGEWLDRIRGNMPELPAARRRRSIAEYGLREYDAETLTATRAMGDYFERAAKVSGDPRATANWVMGDLAGLLKSDGKDARRRGTSAAPAEAHRG
jgi:aspartyl-tRNA(Asn)/glutamyl-tRNA(Gln) amidotransferase subunit B